MLKDTFSQESKVSREIDLLFLRIFGRFQVMQLISNQVKVTTLEKTDPLWQDEIKSNMEYNSTCVGADMWDMICRWNQDILMVKFWLDIYANANPSRIKYFIAPMEKWNKNMEKLLPVIQVFENCGGVDTTSILLEFELKNNIHKYDQQIKDLNKEKGQITATNKSVMDKKEQEIVKLKNQKIKTISTKKSDMENKEKEINDLQKKHLQESNNYKLEISSLKNQNTREINEINKLKNDILDNKNKYDLEKVKSNESFVKIKSEKVTLEEQLINNEAEIKKKEEKIVVFENNKRNFDERNKNV